MPPFISQVLLPQFRNLPLPDPSAVQGTTVIVTGSGHGIGIQAVLHLIRLGAAKVIIAVRSQASGDATKALVEKETGRLHVAEVWLVDLTDFVSVRAFTARVEDELPRVDVLINNAAVALDEWSVSEGLETSLTTNVVGTFLLTILVLPKLRRTAKELGVETRAASVVSSLGFESADELERLVDEGKDILEDLSIEGRHEFVNGKRYGMSKLLQLVANRELAACLPVESTGVTINSTCPGLCNTGLARHTNFFYRLQIRALNGFMGRTPEMGSRTLLAGGFAGRDTHGKFMSACEEKDWHLPEWIRCEKGKQAQAKLWEEIVERLEKASPGCWTSLQASI